MIRGTGRLVISGNRADNFVPQIQLVDISAFLGSAVTSRDVRQEQSVG